MRRRSIDLRYSILIVSATNQHFRSSSGPTIRPMRFAGTDDKAICSTARAKLLIKKFERLIKENC
jgi:hypothetical protein